MPYSGCRGMWRGGASGHGPPLRSQNFTLDIGLSQKKSGNDALLAEKQGLAPPPQESKFYIRYWTESEKVRERRSIGRKTRVGPRGATIDRYIDAS